MASHSSNPQQSNPTISSTASNLAEASREYRHQQSWNDEREFRKNYPLVWLISLLGPPLTAITIVTFFWLTWGWGAATKLVTTAVVSFFAAGKFIILGGGIEKLNQKDFYNAEQLFVLVLSMDLMTASFLVFHLGFLFKLPKMGKQLQAIADNGHSILEAQPWMRRATFIGLMAFVSAPLAMTGSVGGSILGRLLGMSRLGTLVGVSLGNLLGCAAMYFGSNVLKTILKKDDPWLLVGGIVALGAVLYILLNRYQQGIKAATKSKTVIRDP